MGQTNNYITFSYKYYILLHSVTFSNIQLHSVTLSYKYYIQLHSVTNITFYYIQLHSVTNITFSNKLLTIWRNSPPETKIKIPSEKAYFIISVKLPRVVVSEFLFLAFLPWHRFFREVHTCAINTGSVCELIFLTHKSLWHNHCHQLDICAINTRSVCEHPEHPDSHFGALTKKKKKKNYFQLWVPEIISSTLSQRV